VYLICSWTYGLLITPKWFHFLKIPLSVLEEKLPMLKTSLTKTKDSSANGLDKQPHLYAVCRRGNDSYSAVQLLHEKGFHSATLQDLNILFLLHLQNTWFHISHEKKPHASPV
jgi:rhodanese-related sulfurtransferase